MNIILSLACDMDYTISFSTMACMRGLLPLSNQAVRDIVLAKYNLNMVDALPKHLARLNLLLRIKLNGMLTAARCCSVVDIDCVLNIIERIDNTGYAGVFTTVTIEEQPNSNLLYDSNSYIYLEPGNGSWFNYVFYGLQSSVPACKLFLPRDHDVDDGIFGFVEFMRRGTPPPDRMYELMFYDLFNGCTARVYTTKTQLLTPDENGIVANPWITPMGRVLDDDQDVFMKIASSAAKGLPVLIIATDVEE